MDWKKYVRAHLAPLRLGPERELEMADEMAQHLEAVYEAALADGVSEQEAYERAAAHIKDWRLLECELIRSKKPIAHTWINKRLAAEARIESRHGKGGIVMGSLVQDLRYGVRMLLKSKAFTAVAVLSLALGIGANTAIFSLINAVMLRMLPVHDPRELILLSLAGPGRTSNNFNYPLFQRLRENDHFFTGLIAANSVSGLRMTVSEPGAPGEVETVQQAQVSSNYFSVLGVNAVVGRVLADDDERASSPQPVAVISYDFWKRRFGLDPAVVGKNITLNECPFTIVGVTSPGFYGFEVGRKPDLWWPLQAVPLVFPSNQYLKLRGHWWLRVIGRLQPGANVAQARQELDLIVKQQTAEMLAEDPPRSESTLRYFQGLRLELEPGGTGWTTLRAQFKQPLLILMAAVGLVLLTACANVANLLLARASRRRKEIAIRLAIGAGRWRIIRQLLTESLLLAIAGGALGLLLAQWGTGVLITYLPRQQTAGLFVAPDTGVLGFTLAVSVLTGILFGLAPAFHATRINLIASLKNQAGASAGRSRLALNKVLVVTQVALSLFLLIGAGLFMRSLQNLRTVDTGFDRENLEQFVIDPGARLDAARRVTLYKELLDRLEALPGARSASLLSFPLLSGSSITNRIAVPGRAPQPGEEAVCHQMWVGPKFFETMGIPLLSGRDFTKRDELLLDQPPGNGGEDSTKKASTAVVPVFAVINQSMEHHFFANEDPIGKRFTYEGDSTEGYVFEVIGVVKDAKYENLRDASPKTFYSSYFQRPNNNDQTFQLRTLGDLSGLGATLEHAVQEVNPRLHIVGLQTMNDLVDRSLTQERFIAQIAGFFSLFALLLASVGLYGIMSHNVTRRTNEIGIRMALGALRTDVIWMVMRETMMMVAIGVVIGLGAAVATTRVVESMLFGLTATDPVTIALAILAMLAVAAAAGYLPARRASSVDPMIALRYE